MAPAASKRGASARNAAAHHHQHHHDRRSASRHSTPVSALTETPAPPTPPTTAPAAAAAATGSSTTSTATSTTSPADALPRDSAYLHAPTAALVSHEPSIDTLIAGTSARNSDPPTARELHGLHDKIRDTVDKFMGRRNEVCDRSMRQLAQRRKERAQIEREQEAERQARELAAVKRESEEGERKRGKKDRALSKKRSHDEMEVDGESGAGAGAEHRRRRSDAIPRVGAHGLARQDGVGVHEGGPPPPPSPPVDPGTAVIDPMDMAHSPSDSEDDEQAEPPSTIPLYERIFGQDPTKFDDPTVYGIPPLTDDMTYEEKRDILNVTYWPEDDLRHLTAGDPPDQDFSNAKPANQVNFSTFLTYVEPYIRPYTEEDVVFLKERGDRFTPYVIPKRGPKGYRDVWAAEDGPTGVEPPAKLESNPNEPRGSMDDMDDNTAETDEVSMGPVMNRLTSALRAAPNANVKKEQDDADVNGDIFMVNGDDTMLDATQPGTAEEHKPATYLPPDAPRPPNLPQLDYDSLEQRTIQELRYIGFLGPTDVPDFDAHNDDEVAARLRTLQHELRRVAHLNNCRKGRVHELVEERMAMQEYANIADDLDNQVNAAYLKRNRSLGKPSKKAGAASRVGQKGVAVGSAAGARGVSEGVKALMQKRKEWTELVGPVVGFGRPHVPSEDETVFDDESMRRLEREEREAEAEAEAGEAEAE